MKRSAKTRLAPARFNNRRITHQRGVTMLFGLIALAIMMIGAAAMVRSMNTSMMMSGNLGFKRDLTNQAERATAKVMTLMNTGALKTEAARQSTDKNSNYSAKRLDTNLQGVPLELVSDATFANAGVSGNDINVPDQGVVVRYVVDRLCHDVGAAVSTQCLMSDPGAPVGGSAAEALRAEDSSATGGGVLPRQTVYRLSIRVSGPRGTQAYFQTTFTL